MMRAFQLRRRYGNGHGTEEMSVVTVARWHPAWVMGRRPRDEEMKKGGARRRDDRGVLLAARLDDESA